MCCTFKNNVNVSKDPSYWKFNNSLISDTTFTEQMKSLIQKTIADLIKDISLSDKNKWKYLKYKIRNCTFVFSKGLIKNPEKTSKGIRTKIHNA